MTKVAAKIDPYEDRYITANHEAAHAVVAHALGIQVTRLTLKDESRGNPMCWTRDRICMHVGENVALTLAGYWQERLDGQGELARRDASEDLANVAQDLRPMFDANPVLVDWYGSWWRFFRHWAKVSKRAVAAYQDDIGVIAFALMDSDGDLTGTPLRRLLKPVARIDHYSELRFEKVAVAA